MARMKVFAYLRVSDISQVVKGGLDRQIKTIEDFCNQQGYVIERIYKDEGISGTKGISNINSEIIDRPAFSDMVADIKSNGVRTVLVESLDRLARELRIQEQILFYLASQDIELYSANTGENVTQAIKSDPMKKALVQIQGVFAELDKSQLVRRLRKGKDKVKAEKGKCEGRKHYGEKSEIERAIIKRITYMRRKSKCQKRPTSFQKIANVLNDEGIKTILGNKWTASGIKNVIDRKHLTRKKTALK